MKHFLIVACPIGRFYTKRFYKKKLETTSFKVFFNIFKA